MAPSARTRAKTKTTTKARRTNFKKKPVHQKGKQEITPSNSPSNSSSVVCDDPPKIEGGTDDLVGPDDVSTSACSTPKGQRFRIPEIATCPPAPKKQRVISNCLFRRSPIAFFAPPDLELFFYFANGGISV